MWPKRQQTKIRFWTKNEFIKISFGQSLWNFVGVKGISSGRLYEKISGGYKFRFWDVTRNLFHKICFIKSFESLVYCKKWLVLLKCKISEKLTEGKKVIAL
jgi:hypothetical protein